MTDGACPVVATRILAFITGKTVPLAQGPSGKGNHSGQPVHTELLMQMVPQVLEVSAHHIPVLYVS